MTLLSVDTKEKLRTAIDKVEDKFFKVKFSIKKHLKLLDPVHITPFTGFGNEDKVYLRGRVIEKENIKEPDEVDGILDNISNIYKRYESDEIPGVRVKVTINGEEEIVTTNDEGYFELSKNLKTPLDKNKNEHMVHFELLDKMTEDDITTATGKIITPHKNSRFAIISDIDDTVIVSKVTQFLGQAKLMLKKNARQREPFSGISPFLNGLCVEEGYKNPVFYVSGSEWNIYDLLVAFFDIHDIPEGALLLRDKGLDMDKSNLNSGDDYYKVEKIRSIIDMYPEMKFIFIGDSGQKDPETYKQIAEEYPDNILAIYIRDVTSEKRDKEVHKIGKELEKKGIEMVFAKDTSKAAEHALKKKWLDERICDEIRKQVAKDKEEGSD